MDGPAMALLARGLGVVTVATERHNDVVCKITTYLFHHTNDTDNTTIKGDKTTTMPEAGPERDTHGCEHHEQVQFCANSAGRLVASHAADVAEQ